MKALAMIEETGERWHEPEAHRLNGELLLSLPDAETGVAKSAFRKAIEVARGEQAKWPELRAARGLARRGDRTGQAHRCPRPPGAYLRLVHRGLRHAGHDRGQDAARRAVLTMAAPGYNQPSQPVTGHVRYRADSGRHSRRCPLSRGFGGFTLSSRHGGQVIWKAVPDPKLP